MTVTLAQAIQWQKQQEELMARALVFIKDRYMGDVSVLGVEIVQGAKLVSIYYSQSIRQCTDTGFEEIDFDKFFEN